DPPSRTSSLHRPLEDRHTRRCEVIRDAVETLHKEAQIRRARGRLGGFGIELLPLLMQVDLVRPKAQCGAPPGSEHLPGHAEHAFVELDRSLDGSDGEDEMIKACHPHRMPPCRHRTSYSRRVAGSRHERAGDSSSQPAATAPEGQFAVRPAQLGGSGTYSDCTKSNQQAQFLISKALRRPA